ncbi:MAG: hypothetical protein E7160_00410 [Firmicutes bacterium]|nr:hypothetical protein [Bacillota bacterium]
MINKYKLLITGKNINYFLQKIINNNIQIYDLEQKDKKLIIIVNEEDYQKIRKIKTSYKIKILNRYGQVKIKYLLKKYHIFIMSIIIGILLNVLLSNIIFDVKVIHSNPRIRNIIYRDLEIYGIKKYHLIKSYKTKERIITKILEKETNDIEWLEIENIGTKYIVRVEQRKKNKQEKKCIPRNIIAKKDSMIINIDATRGEVSKKKYDYVKKGEVLISGLIHNKETIVSKECATGKVYGEVWYKVELELPNNYYEQTLTGNEKKYLEVEIFNKHYSILNKYKNYKRKKLFIIKSKILPISLNYTKYLETKVKREKYTLNNVNSKAITIAKNKLQSRINKEDSIISKKVLKKQQKNSKIIVDVFFKVKEEISEIESIEDINIEEENKKNSKEQ